MFLLDLCPSRGHQHGVSILGYVFPKISHMKYRTDLIPSEAFCMFIFFYFPVSGLPVLTGLKFLFLRA